MAVRARLQRVRGAQLALALVRGSFRVAERVGRAQQLQRLAEVALALRVPLLRTGRAPGPGVSTEQDSRHGTLGSTALYLLQAPPYSAEAEHGGSSSKVRSAGQPGSQGCGYSHCRICCTALLQDDTVWQLVHLGGFLHTIARSCCSCLLSCSGAVRACRSRRTCRAAAACTWRSDTC